MKPVTFSTADDRIGPNHSAALPAHSISIGPSRSTRSAIGLSSWPSTGRNWRPMPSAVFCIDELMRAIEAAVVSPCSPTLAMVASDCSMTACMKACSRVRPAVASPVLAVVLASLASSASSSAIFLVSSSIFI